MMIETTYERMKGAEFRRIYKGFGVSIMASEDLSFVSDPSAIIEEWLNLHLNITNYSQNIAEYVFLFMAINPQHGLKREDKVQFLRSTKAVRVFMNLDRERLAQATTTSVLKQMCELYLLSIETYLSKRKDFDAKVFYEDVKNLFEKKGWLKQASTP